MEIRPVAVYHGELPSKFGIPRQSGLVPSLRGRIVFEPEFRNREALRGLEGFDRIWLVWEFSANRPAKGDWQPTVRPPRLGGNTAMGVWATRSPFRPNPLGLSCVELEAIDGMELVVRGADLMDGTPIYDISLMSRMPTAFPMPGAALPPRRRSRCWRSASRTGWTSPRRSGRPCPESWRWTRVPPISKSPDGCTGCRSAAGKCTSGWRMTF